MENDSPMLAVGARISKEDIGEDVSRSTDNVNLWVVEETDGVLRASGGKDKLLRLYRVLNDQVEVFGEFSLSTKTPGERVTTKVSAVLNLLHSSRVSSGIVVCSHRVAGTTTLVRTLYSACLHFVVEVAPATRVAREIGGKFSKLPVSSLCALADWQSVNMRLHQSDAIYTASDLGCVSLVDIDNLRAFGISVGGIEGYQRGLRMNLAHVPANTSLEDLAYVASWIQRVRIEMRARDRKLKAPQLRDRPERETSSGSELKGRPNLRIARRLDETVAATLQRRPNHLGDLRGALRARRQTLNIVELFAGAGGMGLGFLLAGMGQGNAYRIVHSAEVNPIYVHTLRANHGYMKAAGLLPKRATPAKYEPIDLRTQQSIQLSKEVSRMSSGVDILIGGPPCQGFSAANRNSWSSSNPNNQLVDAFLDHVSVLRPRVLIMENVQGILWTPRDEDGLTGTLSVASHVMDRLQNLGYLVFPKLLDAAWYGVPQHRSRFFLAGIHRSLGYQHEDFGSWGPFPHPTHGPGTRNSFVTVQQAIGDLPEIGNGASVQELPYRLPAGYPRTRFLRFVRCGAPKGVIWDHQTSRHADYVIERYSRIPEGGNWEDIKDLMTNYAEVSRTHSNIYRRLSWSEPAVTIGHYRKSMLIHPRQHRGLSLREAARLQSFPDWFRFAGSKNSLDAGLMHKQQQLANAVCPLVTKAVAEYLLAL